MTRKTEEAYRAILRHVKDHILPENNITLAMSDFERALRNAVNAVFTTAQSTGCNTHYDRVCFV